MINIPDINVQSLVPISPMISCPTSTSFTLSLLYLFATTPSSITSQLILVLYSINIPKLPLVNTHPITIFDPTIVGIVIELPMAPPMPITKIHSITTRVKYGIFKPKLLKY